MFQYSSCFRTAVAALQERRSQRDNFTGEALFGVRGTSAAEKELFPLMLLVSVCTFRNPSDQLSSLPVQKMQLSASDPSESMS